MIATMDNFMTVLRPLLVFLIHILTQSSDNCQIDFLQKTCYPIRRSCQLSGLETRLDRLLH